MTTTVKAAAFVEFIATHNDKAGPNNAWTAQYNTTESTTILIAKRNNETIELRWFGDGEVYDYPNSSFSRAIGGDTFDWKIRNVSEARKIILGLINKGAASGNKRSTSTPEPAEPTTPTPTPAAPKAKPTTTAAKPKRTRKADKEDLGIPKPSLPFDPETATDEEVLEAIRGRFITWKSGAVKRKGRVYPRNLKIEVSPRTNKRLITFADTDGFKTVYVSAITSVGEPFPEKD